MKLYIDPGTGSMLFTILLGLLGTAGYLFRKVFVKARFLFSGGREKADVEERLPYVIFTDHKRYWNTFEPICDAFEKRGLPLVYMTASPDDPALEKKYEHVQCRFIGEGNHAYARMNRLKADVVLSTTPGLDVYQWKRSKGVKWYVHVLHATTDPQTYRMFGLDYYDAILLSGDYQGEQIREIEKLRNLPPKEFRMVGLPYMDRMQARADAAPPVPDHPLTVLISPSWGPNCILNRYGEKMIEAALATGYHIIYRPHPQYFVTEKELLERVMKAYPASDQLEWNLDNDNFEVLRRSDIMISDHSGIMFDFALIFGKPVIYADTSFDDSPYDAWWVEGERWMFQVLPKLGKQLTPENLPHLKELIDDVLATPALKENLEEVRNASWVPRGNSAELIADYMEEKRKELTEARPEQ